MSTGSTTRALPGVFDREADARTVVSPIADRLDTLEGAPGGLRNNSKTHKALSLEPSASIFVERDCPL